MDSKYDYLACPVCKTGLSGWDASLVCKACHRKFEIHQNIPILCSTVDKTRLAIEADTFASHVITPVSSSHEKNINDWKQFLLEIISGVSTSKSGNHLVLNLVDETKAAPKFLMNISPKDHVLNLGPGLDNTTINLARTAEKVTTLDLNLGDLFILMLKKKYYGLNNIDLLYGGADKCLPLRDHTFDAVFIQDSLLWSILPFVCTDKKRINKSGIWDIMNGNIFRSGEYNHTIRLHTFLIEIKRILKPKGEVLIGIKDYPDKKSIRTELEKKTTYLTDVSIRGALGKDWLRFPTSLYSKHRKINSIIEMSGFKKGRAHLIAPTPYAPERMIDLSIGMGKGGVYRSIRSFTQIFQKKKRHTHTSYIGCIAHIKDSTLSWINGMIQDLAQSCNFPLDQYAIDKIHISRKGKLIVMLKNITSDKNSLVIKVPFHDVAQGMLENNYHTLDFLGQIKQHQGVANLFLDAIPKCVHNGIYKGQVYFAEEGIEGVEWKKVIPLYSDKIILSHTLQLLNAMNRIPMRHETNQNVPLKFEKRFDCIEGDLVAHETREKRVWEVIKRRLFEVINCSNHPRYFRKGDFSMHNVILASEKKPMIIDFDESGHTLFKTIDLADLLFSYVRIRKKISREKFLRIVLEGNFKKLGLSVALNKILAFIEADLDEFKNSSLISWIDHVYFAIQFEPIKYRKYILNRSFSKTLISLESVIDRI